MCVRNRCQHFAVLIGPAVNPYASYSKELHPASRVGYPDVYPYAHAHIHINPYTRAYTHINPHLYTHAHAHINPYPNQLPYLHCAR